MNLDRRSLLKFAAAGASLAAVHPGSLRADDGFPLGDLDAHIRMRCNLKGERTYWYYRGTVFGNVWGKATAPLLDVEGVSYSTVDPLADGRYRYNLNEAGYYGAPGSGEVSERVLNPFTGEYIEPQNYLSPQTVIFEADLSVTPVFKGAPPPGLEYRGVIAPVSTFGDSVWSAEDIFVRMPLPNPDNDPDAPDFRVQTSLATFTASRRDLLNTDLDFVPCQMNYQTLGTFRPWMGMGATPGMISWRMIGTKCRYDDLPAPIVERISGDHAGFFG